MKKAKNILPLPTRLLLYNALIKPHLDYGCLIWGGGKVDKLVTLQKKAIRLIDSNQNWTCHTNPLFWKYKILKLPDLIWLSETTIAFQASIKETPIAITRKFEFETNTGVTRKRGSLTIKKQAAKTNKQANYLLFRVATAWNVLAEDHKYRISTWSFKKLMKRLANQRYEMLPKCAKKYCQSCVKT